MPELILPAPSLRASFLTAMAEFIAEGRDDPGDNSMLSLEIAAYAPGWESEEDFRRYVEDLRAQALEETPRQEGFVPSTTYWYAEGDEYLGRLAIRHRLTDRLLQEGGHIGYDVRPSARRRGHATRMLAAALTLTTTMGIDRVLVTCNTTNEASRRVIEKNGGVLEDERDGKLRFWIG